MMNDEKFGCFGIFLFIAEACIIVVSLIRIIFVGGSRFDYYIIIGCIFDMVFRSLEAKVKEEQNKRDQEK